MNCATLCLRPGASLSPNAAKLAELTPLKKQKNLISKNYFFIVMNLILIFCSESRVNADIVEIYTNQGVALGGTYAENNSYIFGNTFNTNANLSKISSVSMYLLKSSAPINGNMFVSISTVKSSQVDLNMFLTRH
jgi:hypothetical protein